MALGNIQWRFQEPIDFGSQIMKMQEMKQKKWADIGKNLGSGIRGLHDYMLDRELADMIEGNQKQGDVDSANQEQMSREVSLINQEIQRLEAENSLILQQIERLKPSQQPNQIESQSDNEPLGVL